MEQAGGPTSNELAEHLFRIEYGRIVSVVTGILGIENLSIAEDIAQDTFLKAVTSWELNGIPPNPQAWLYVTAKNNSLNALKKNYRVRNYKKEKFQSDNVVLDETTFSEDLIADEQLKMMFVFCSPLLSPDSQIALILQILCGFSIAEISSAFYVAEDTIHKRLVRARKKLKEHELSFELANDFENEIPIVLRAIYLLFNEGYQPSQIDAAVRKELCFEAIRLAEILKSSSKIKNKEDCFALLSLMYINVSRFNARIKDSIEMKHQNRDLWDKSLLNKGISYLNKTLGSESISIYNILAAISANHSVAASYEETNWEEIFQLYDSLLQIEDTPLVRLNRSVALAKVKGNRAAINELVHLNEQSGLDDWPIYHSTLAEFYHEEHEINQARMHLGKAILKSKNPRDIKILKKKLNELVPV